MAGCNEKNSQAVGTHDGPTRIHVADYSLRHRRDGNAGTTILYHLRNRRRPHSSSGMTAGRRGCWGWAPPPLPPGPQDLPRDYGPDGAAGGLKPEYTAASGPRTFGSGPTTGTRSQTTCYVRRGTGRVVLTIDSERFFLVQLTAVEERRKNHLNLKLRVLSSKVQLRFESLIKGTVA